MMQSQILLCAIPGELWHQEYAGPEPFSTLQALIQDALDIERRLPKNVNIENERTRFTLCCQQIESIALQFASPFTSGDEFYDLLKRQRFPSFTIDEDYLYLLFHVELMEQSRKMAQDIRLGSSFFPPNDVLIHNTQFDLLAQEMGWQDRNAIQMRKAFFQLAASVNCGVIEVQSALTSVKSEVAVPSLQDLNTPKPSAWVDSSSVVAEVVQGSRREQMAQQLKHQIQQAMQTDTIVNMSNQPHDITTDVLHDFVYVRGNEQLKGIRIVYADGSEAETFPLSCLPRYSDQQLIQLGSLFPLRIALISMRHLELDRLIDITWFRNRDASKSRTLAEADKFCYEYSRNQFMDLKNLARRTNGLQVHLYHTGFEPAVIAFYRAFVHSLLDMPINSRDILIVPHYYRGDEEFERGRPWM